jgi:alkylation response protein AidB-like acyl-CoA dehydrogenase
MIDDSAWIMVSALIMEHGQPRMTPFGPAMVGVMMQTSEVKILDTWHSLGMKGTDSNDAEFSDVFVPAQRSFLLTPEYERGKHFGGPLYRYPAIPIIALFSAAVLLSTARGSIDEFRALAERKVPMGSMKSVRDRGVVQAALAESEALLRSARAFFVGTLDEAWDRTTSGQPHTMEHRADLLLAGINAARAAALVTDTMQRLAGTSGMYTKSALDRYFRDAHTLRNHGFASESKLESVGQVYLGLQPDFPLMMF